MAKRAGSETLAMSVYEELRFGILSGRLKPGERLRPTELSGQFGVGLGVMREAIGLLAAKDLVRIDRNRGCHVMSLSLEALTHLNAARKITEGAALRMSVERGGLTWESELIAAHYRMASLPIYLPDDPTVRSEEWALAHMDFHHRLIAACGNPVLLDICARLTDSGEVYRAWSGPGSRERDITAEHKELLDAALAHDAGLAVRLLEAHIDRTQTILAASTLAADQPPAEA
ncbi:GntR family transcriptional regulator [Actinocorallia sp. A-T 12471]|uniref:GntR family transcriptional regulator n=1 Tax=Actinocorallia sp. A-T 12471 TaxID=3089813 RepID=UPI0029CD6358|nr:GntR family transcriptional regulator [Actinocorallia sp. A-T 12471]MDX6740217.1 GntR family transcriptional regulator [Actinocorallia sp. A-T 12471]